MTCHMSPSSSAICSFVNEPSAKTMLGVVGVTLGRAIMLVPVLALARVDDDKIVRASLYASYAVTGFVLAKNLLSR